MPDLAHTISKADSDVVKNSSTGVSSNSVCRLASNVVRDRGSWQTEDTKLLRAASVTAVLGRAGKILSNSGGSLDTYNMSRTVTTIRAFLSHNWSVPRFAKFFVLALHFNFGKSVASMYFSALVMLLLRMICDVPNLYWPVGDQGLDYCLFAGLFTFFASMCFAHEAYCDPSPKVFLDKICIHQTNAELKAQGIAALPSFVLSSKEMVIVFGEDYLRRLWTAYELASFLLLNPTGKLTPLPLHLPRFVFGFMMWSLMFMYAHIELFHLKDIVFAEDGDGHEEHDHDEREPCFSDIVGHEVFMVITLVIVPVTIAFLVLAVERYMRAQRRVHDISQLFDIRKAACFHEPDRVIVEDSVVEFMKATVGITYMAETDMDTQRTEILEEFNRIARKQIPESLDRIFGHVGLPYKYACVMFSVFVLRSFDTLAISMREHVPAWKICLLLVVTGFRAFALWPCWLGLICTICRASVLCSTRKRSGSLQAFLRISAGLGLFVIFWCMDMFLFTGLVTLHDDSEADGEHEGHDSHDHAGHGDEDHGDHDTHEDENHDAHEDELHDAHQDDDHDAHDDEDHDAHDGNEDEDHDAHEDEDHDGHGDEDHDTHEGDQHNENESDDHANGAHGEYSELRSVQDHGNHEVGNHDTNVGSQLPDSSTGPQPLELVASLCAAVLVLCLLVWLWRPFRHRRGRLLTARKHSSSAPPVDDEMKTEAEHHLEDSRCQMPDARCQMAEHHCCVALEDARCHLDREESEVETQEMDGVAQCPRSIRLDRRKVILWL